MNKVVVNTKSILPIEAHFIHVALEPTFDFKEHIQQAIISKKLPLNLYFFEFSSELNKLNGQWNLFLDSRKPFHEIWNDFILLVEQYIKVKD